MKGLLQLLARLAPLLLLPWALWPTARPAAAERRVLETYRIWAIVVDPYDARGTERNLAEQDRELNHPVGATHESSLLAAHDRRINLGSFGGYRRLPWRNLL